MSRHNNEQYLFRMAQENGGDNKIEKNIFIMKLILWIRFRSIDRLRSDRRFNFDEFLSVDILRTDWRLI